MCAFCGDFSHMTHNCGNMEAREATWGKCYRCGHSGHTKANCIVGRCGQCGQFGHTSQACTSTKVLSKKEKSKIAHEELNHSRAQKQRIERQKQKQLGGHDPKVPVVQVTTKSPPPEGAKNAGLSKADGQGLGKRRRTVSPPTEIKKGGERDLESAGSTPTSKNSRRKLNVQAPQPTTVSMSLPSTPLPLDICD